MRPCGGRVLGDNGRTRGHADENDRSVEQHQEHRFAWILRIDGVEVREDSADADRFGFLDQGAENATHAVEGLTVQIESCC